MLPVSPCPGISWRLMWPCFFFLEFTPRGAGRAQRQVPRADLMPSLLQVGGMVASAVAGDGM